MQPHTMMGTLLLVRKFSTSDSKAAPAVRQRRTHICRQFSGQGDIRRPDFLDCSGPDHVRSGHSALPVAYRYERFGLLEFNVSLSQ